MFLDETAAATNMICRYGWAPPIQRYRIAVPHGQYKTTTVTAALRASGPFAFELMDGAANGRRFEPMWPTSSCQNSGRGTGW